MNVIRYFLFLFFIAILPTQVAATWQSDFSLSVGERVDKVNWSIAGKPSPNIISELNWDDVRTTQLSGEFQFVKDRTWLLNGYYSKGWVNKGNNQDSDYNGNNRTLEFSRSNSNTDGNILDYGVAIGRIFDIQDGYALTPILGYSQQQQHFKMSNGTQTLCDAGATPNNCQSGLGEIAGLNSRYDSQWSGPWVGLKLTYQAQKKLKLFTDIAYHQVQYKATMDWNLRDDLQHPISQSQYADGQGIKMSVGGLYQLQNNVNFDFSSRYFSLNAQRNGTHTFHTNTGNIQQKLNEVNSQSLAFYVGISARF